MSRAQPPVRIGADIGGTFTDVVVLDAVGNVWTQKVPSTPPDFERAVLRAAERLLPEAGVAGGDVVEVAHGTTVATNAVLEHRGARAALITTRGFRDVLALRRVRAPQMYDLFFDKPRDLIERRLRFELTERVAADGQVVTPLAEAELEEIGKKLAGEGIESVAVCLLHAYAHPRHEQLVGDYLSRKLPGVQVSLSSDVLRERGEYERTATTAVNAYVRPVMQRYLGALESGLRQQQVRAPLLLMHSAGGLTPADDAALRPVFVLESGPAAGVLAAQHTARQLGLKNFISLDVGGTTAKAALIEGGRLPYSSQYEVGAGLSAGNRLAGGAGDTIRAPTIDIAEVGSGGGSVAWLDRAGGLRVGPRSAGAVPGPACYGRGGTEPTVTDANVVLGYIRPGRLADGDVVIDPEAAQRSVHDRVAAPLGMDLLRAAEGIHRIANARTLRALRSVSTERGRDPREFMLIAFGGSGPVHAAGLAEELHSQSILVPPLPGLFSALGLLFAGIEHHDARSCLLSGPALTAEALESVWNEMKQGLLAQFARDGWTDGQVIFSGGVDVRYQGQASEIRLTVPEPSAAGPWFTDATLAALRRDFEAEHLRLYGHLSDPANAVQVVAVRIIGRVPAAGQTERLRLAGQPAPAQPARRAFFGPRRGSIETPVVRRSEIDAPCDGPLLIDEYDSTVVVPPGMRIRRDEWNNLVLEPCHG